MKNDENNFNKMLNIIHYEYITDIGMSYTYKNVIRLLIGAFEYKHPIYNNQIYICYILIVDNSLFSALCTVHGVTDSA